MEDWFIPYQTSPLPRVARALVLAPHPDDEIFGCGGALALLKRQGVNIEVIVLSDGAGQLHGEQRDLVKHTRQAETKAALKVIGIDSVTFWDLPDRSLAMNSEWVERLRTCFGAYDLVFAPSPTEIHPDHQATAKAVLSILDFWPSDVTPVPNILFYEVGTPLVPNCLVDISSVWPEKRAAMLEFNSQQNAQDYARHIEGLNVFRCYTLRPDVKYAEAYYLLKPEDAVTHLFDRHVPSRWYMRSAAGIERTVANAFEAVEQLHQNLRKTASVLDEQKKLVDQQSHQLTQQSHQLTQQGREISELSLQQQQGEAVAAQLRQAISYLESTQESLFNSLSWRLTKPLRWLGRVLRSML